MSNHIERYRSEILARLAEHRDLRYFDASPDNINPVSNAGEMIRRDTARRELAERTSHSVAQFTDQLIRQTMVNMDARDLLYTLKALEACPRTRLCDICGDRIFADEKWSDDGTEVAHTACVEDWFRRNYGAEGLD